MKKIESESLTNSENSVDYYNYKSFDFEKNIVFSIVDKFLPVIFWLGLSIIFIEALHRNIEIFNWNFLEGIFGFCRIFIPFALGHILLFYIIYTVRDIKKSLNKKK
ncbi:hypothetical protein CRV08_03270 [Halarcobacter ebronensis]|uniref:Uncharacterized protein n=1 Tax=Halarcobacter ebronensis TaxID=1462615 RepID=A0A4Q0YKJ6_9BACT|nr:hypothetical protein [Halarcobacter ebronensis]RXJ69739.1 hypothetical protein CRV08_03270 [Halarcobacter ebronensis]